MNRNKLNSFLFILFIFACLLLIALYPLQVLYPAPTDDEVNYYKPASDGMHSQGIDYLKTHPDTKPLSFLYIEYLLNGSIVYTRILNYILIGLTTYFIFKVTSSKLAILYPLIPIFLNGMTLTDEIIPAMFVVASFYYMQYNGVFIGLAAIFNPFSVLYGFLLNKKNAAYFVIIGSSFAGLLLILGLFFPYLIWLIRYEGLSETKPIGWIVIAFLGIFYIMGSKNKTILKYAILSTIPVITRPYFEHYYIVPYTVLFVGYLLSHTENLNKRYLLI